MERNNIDKAVYVGDTILDKEAADLAGIPFVFASYGFGNVKNPDYSITKPMELIELTKEIFR